MNKSLQVMSGELWVKSSPLFFWGIKKPTNKDLYNGIVRQIKLDGCQSIDTIKFKKWQIILTEFDWVSLGLQKINSCDEIKLFNEMVRYSTDDGKVGVRLEYPLKVYVRDLALYRQGKLSAIKGEIDVDVIDLIENKEDLDLLTVLVFR